MTVVFSPMNVEYSSEWVREQVSKTRIRLQPCERRRVKSFKIV